VGFFIEIGICNTACDVMLCHRLIAVINTYNKNRQIVNEMLAEQSADHEHKLRGWQLCLLAFMSHWCFLAIASTNTEVKRLRTNGSKVE
jgi:hypothetical protein